LLPRSECPLFACVGRRRKGGEGKGGKKGMTEKAVVFFFVVAFLYKEEGIIRGPFTIADTVWHMFTWLVHFFLFGEGGKKGKKGGEGRKEGGGGWGPIKRGGAFTWR